MTARTITATCRFDCEMDIGPDASQETEEIRKIYDEILGVRLSGRISHDWIDLSEFKNESDQTIGEFFLAEYPKLAYALVKKGDNNGN